jgi:hypothetical protein
MPDLQGQVRFPGVAQVVSARYVYTSGVAPGVAVLDIAPQPGVIFSGGTLELDFGSIHLALPDCRVERIRFQRTEQGTIWRLKILDRRWRWTFGRISGTYNLRRDNGDLIDETERTPAQLAELCLEAMGESDFDVSALPATPRLTVEWDHDSPAQVLAQLAAQCGCRVVLAADNRVMLATLDAGDQPTSLPETMQFALSAIEAPAADRITLVSGPVRYQADFRLEAVGLDVDGEIRPLDQLSYKPAGGWSLIDLEHFQAVNDRRARELAKATVFRWYRIRTPFELPTHGVVNDLGLIVPIEDEQVDLTTIPEGTARNRSAVVFGVWCDYAQQSINRTEQLQPLPPADLARDPATIVTTPFAIDADRALVKFIAPVIRYVDGPLPAPADLVLRTAVGVRNALSRAWIRREHTRQIGSEDRTTLFLRRDDLLPRAVGQYDPVTYALVGATTNFAAIETEADAALDIAEARFATRHPQRVVYAGLHPFQPDGLIDRVVWTIGPAGTTTEVICHDPYRQGTMRWGRFAPIRSRIDTSRAKRQLKRLPVV